MFPTALIYSSHNRSEVIHRWWLVERALRSLDNKTFLYVPMSMNEMHQQEYTWGTFRWYLDRFRQWGLESRNFFWRDGLEKSDVELFFKWLRDSEVVVLGGGNSLLGMERFYSLGEQHFGDKHLFGKILRDRQRRGKLTAGFSAGASQLCSLMETVLDYPEEDSQGFGLAHNIMCTLHYEAGRDEKLKESAKRFPHFMAFGLPNDSGLAFDQGFLSSGNIWQVIECIVDTSWDLPQDSWHIKTRSGMNIEHYYNDGRDWTFKNGDKIVRIISSNHQDYDAWVLQANGGPIYHYCTQQPTQYQRINSILESH
ncbi:MAG: Type 1 glutamine amidotransferase-like domain-containing protein, partial [Planctomycetota bacterium]